MLSVNILLDRSASMASRWEEALSSLNTYAKGLPKDARIRLAVFDAHTGHDDYVMIRNALAAEWVDLSVNEVSPRGSTPLLDAAARMMHGILHENAQRAVFVVITDGHENASTYARKTLVTALQKEMEKNGYETVFLGANFENVGDNAVQFGLDAATRSVNLNVGTMNAYSQLLAEKSVAYATVGASMEIDDRDRTIAKGNK